MTEAQAKHITNLMRERDRIVENSGRKLMVTGIDMAVDWNIGCATQPSCKALNEMQFSVQAAAESMFQDQAKRMVRRINDELRVLGVTD
jgi:hypothetical protein